MCGNDPDKALEHYMKYGAPEGRSGCGKYDIIKFLKKYPETVLSAEFTNNINTPEKYFEAVQPKIESANASGGSVGGGGGSGSGGGSTPTANKKFTMIYYYIGSNLESGDGEMTAALIDTMLGLYAGGNANINVIAALGGADTWHSPYLNGLLGATDDRKAQTKYFSIDVNKTKAALEAVSKSTGIPVSSMNDVLNNSDAAGYAVSKALREALYDKAINAETVTLIGTPADNDMAKKETLEGLLQLATTTYKADNYALSLSGHGGGSLGGVTINVDQLAIALKDKGFGADNGKLSLIAFDACIMGGVETARLLKDYYTYMYATETFQRSDIGYYALIKSIINNINDPDLAKKIALTVFTSRSAYETGSGDLQAATIFESAEAMNAIAALEDWSLQMISNIGNPDSEQAKKIFMAMKKASIRSYQISGGDTRDDNYNYLDIQDYIIHLKAELNAYGITACDESMAKVISAVDQFTTANSYNYDGAVIYNSEQGGFIDASNSLWKEYLHYYFCGGNIMFPTYAYTTSIYNESTVEERIKGVREDILNYYTSKYQENAGLKNYCNLLSQYIGYYVSAKEFDRVRALSNALTNGSGTKYEQLANVTFTPDGKAIRVTVNNYGTNLPVPMDGDKEISSGDAYLDLMDTARSFTAYLTRMVSVKKNPDDTSGATVAPDATVSIVFAEKNIEYLDMDGDKNAVTVILKELIETTVVNYVVGSSSVAKDADALDMVLRSEYDSTDNKRDLLCGIDDDYKELASNSKAAYDRWKAEPEGDTKDQLWKDYEAADGLRSDYYYKHYDLSEYQIYAGICDYSDGTTEHRKNYIQFIFKKKEGSNNEYSYLKSIEATKVDGSPTTYAEIDKVYAISFIHYYMTEGPDGTGTDILLPFEERTDITYNENGTYKGYGEAADARDKGYKYYYYVGGADKDTVTIVNTELSGLDKNVKDNGYFIAMQNLNGGQIDLNQQTDGSGAKHDPLTTDEYTGLILIGKTKDPNYVAPITPPSAARADEQSEVTAEESTIVNTETSTEVISEETSTTATPEVIPVQALIEEKVTTDESSETSENAA